MRSKITLALVLCAVSLRTWPDTSATEKPLFPDPYNDLSRIEILVQQARARQSGRRNPRGTLSPVMRLARSDSAFARETEALRNGPQLLDYADLAARIGQQITITTFEARRHSGQISSVDAGGVTLLVTQRGGSASFRIRKDRIREIEGF